MYVDPMILLVTYVDPMIQLVKSSLEFLSQILILIHKIIREQTGLDGLEKFMMGFQYIVIDSFL